MRLNLQRKILVIRILYQYHPEAYLLRMVMMKDGPL